MPDPSNEPSFYNDTRGFTVDDVNPDELPPCVICGKPAEEAGAPTCGEYGCYTQVGDHREP